MQESERIYDNYYNIGYCRVSNCTQESRGMMSICQGRVAPVKNTLIFSTEFRR
jgi:hypothetical protein